MYRAFGFASIVKFLAIMLMLAYTVVGARVLGAEQFGELVYWVSVISVLGVVFTGGIQRVALKVTEIVVQEGRSSQFTNLLLIFVCAMVVWALILWIFILGFCGFLPGVWKAAAAGLFVYSFFRAVLLVESEILQGIGQGALALLVQQVAVYGITIFLMFAGTALFSGILPIHFYGLAVVLSVFVGIVVILNCEKNYAGCLKSLPEIFTPNLFAFLLADLFLILQFQSHFLILGSNNSLAHVGMLAIAYRVGQFGAVAQDVANSAFSHKYANLLRQNKTAELSLVVGKATVICTIQSVVFLLLVILLGEKILRYLYGPEYVESFIPLVIISLAMLVSSGCGPAGRILVIGGRSRELLLSISLSLLVGGGVSWLLSIRYGVLGVSFGMALTIVLHNALMAFYCHRALGLGTWISLRALEAMVNDIQFRLESRSLEARAYKLVELILRGVEDKIWEMQRFQVVECFGDSHARVFRKLNDVGIFKKTRFRTTFIRGATARSMANPESTTGAHNVFESRIRCIPSGATLFFLMGEVDCGATYWLKKQSDSGQSENEFLKDSVRNYSSYLNGLARRGFDVCAISVPPPILTDQEAAMNAVDKRRSLGASRKDINRLVFKFNALLAASCEQRVNFIDVSPFLYDDGQFEELSQSLRSEQLGDHHYNRMEYARRISKALLASDVLKH